jgi:hypothetical protein
MGLVRKLSNTKAKRDMTAKLFLGYCPSPILAVFRKKGY